MILNFSTERTNSPELLSPYPQSTISKDRFVINYLRVFTKIFKRTKCPVTLLSGNCPGRSKRRALTEAVVARVQASATRSLRTACAEMDRVKAWTRKHRVAKLSLRLASAVSLNVRKAAVLS